MAGCACARSRRAPAAKASKGREPRMNRGDKFCIVGGCAAPGAGGGFGMLLPILLFIPLLYLLMIRPQQKRQKQWQQMLAGIKSGDRITTAGGIRGIILSIKDDSIIIRVAPDNLKLEVAKSAIASVTTQEGTSNHKGPRAFWLFDKRIETMKKESQEQNCPDHRGSADLPVWHLRDSVGDQRQGIAGAMSNRIHLGLDLQGGAHLILQVQVSEAVNAETDNSVQEIQQDLKKGEPGLSRRWSSPIRTSRM